MLGNLAPEIYAMPKQEQDKCCTQPSSRVGVTTRRRGRDFRAVFDVEARRVQNCIIKGLSDMSIYDFVRLYLYGIRKETEP